MIVKNPHTEKIGITYVGVDYSVEAGGELRGVPTEAAKHWKTIHAFIKIEPDVVAPRTEVATEVKKEVKAPETPKVEPKVEEIKEVATAPIKAEVVTPKK